MMTPADITALKQQLVVHEAIRLVVYDDATGLPIRAGTLVRGNPTIGIGRELSKHGISRDEAFYLCDNDIAEVVRDLTAMYPWFATLDVVRQRAIVDLAFNEGARGLMKSPRMVAAIIAHDFDTAAKELNDGPWHLQVGPKRSIDVETMLRTGVDVMKGLSPTT